MAHKKIKGFLLLGYLGLALLGCKETQPVKKTRPNVVLFVVDDLGWTDTSTYGSDLYQTPNVDTLANNGVQFTDAYAACTVCSPTRASIMTGKYPARINLTDWITGHQRPYGKYSVPDWTQYLRHQDTTMAEALKDLGYQTAHIGKWHLGHEEQYWPENHGFDTNIGGWKMGQPNGRKDKFEGGYFPPYQNPRLTDGKVGEYLTERLTQEATSYIRQNAEKPFFLNFWLYNVHTPLQAKQEKIAKYDAIVDSNANHHNPVYAAMVEHMDDALGKVMAQLKESGLYENTIIIFASDNGGLTGNRGNAMTKPTVTSNYPLRTGKGDMYEGGVRTPFIISWPKRIKGGETTEALSISTDIFPTVMGLLNGRTPEGIDGEDLSGLLLKGEVPEREALFWHYPHYHTEGASPYSAVRKGDWKLIQVYESDTLQLYNLKDDIGEKNNLFFEHPDKAEQLLELLNDWKDEMQAQEPIPNPNYDPEKEFVWKNEWSK